jgi:diguanylate cyclase (GGDEF)-like protein
MSRRSFRLSAVIGRSAPKGFSLASIRGRVVVFAVLAALIPTGITGWIAYRQTQRSLERGVNQELGGLALRSARAIDRWIAARQHDAQDIAGSLEMRDILAQLSSESDRDSRSSVDARVVEYLASAQQRTPGIVALALLDSPGRIVGPGNRQFAGLPDDWPDRLQAGATVIGHPRWDSVTERAVLSLAVPMRSGSRPERGPLGGLVVTGDFTGVLAVLRDGPTPDRPRLSLIGREDGVLVDPQGDLSPSRAGPPADAARAALTDETPLGAYRAPDGTDILGAMSPLEEAPWVVLAEIPRSVAYAEVTRIRNVTLLILLGALVTVGFVAFRLAQIIVRPLDRLTRGAAEVASGDFAVELPPSGGSEVGYLTDVFNYMVARLREGRAELERLSVTDALTGLHNRRKLAQNMEYEIQRSGRTGNPFGVLLMDVDEFKTVNDRFGHHAGDHVLVALAHVLRESVRVIDSVSRYGGEEFVVVLPETDLASAVETAERIRTEVASREVSLGDEQVGVTVSIGVAEFPSDGASIDAIIDSADGALYRAKDRGRNRVETTRSGPSSAPGR